MDKKECNLDCLLNLEGYCQLSEFGLEEDLCDVKSQEDLISVPPDFSDDVENAVRGGVEVDGWKKTLFEKEAPEEE